MIEVKNLTKWYGRTLAVDNATFHVEAGHIVGFLGPNGAGKSTTLKILTCFLPASSGSARVDGYDVFRQSIQVRQRIGYMPENVPVYPEMRVREYLMFRAALRGIPVKERPGRIDKVMETCWLSHPEDMSRRRMDHLSRGYQQRLGLADVLLHDPPVLVLDEPTIGLDPVQVREMRNLIRQLGQDHTIILSSHILAEVEQICEQLIFICRGQVVAQGQPGELRKQVDGPARVTVELRGGAPEEMAKALGEIAGAGEVETVRAGNWTRLSVQGPPGEDLRPQVAAKVAEKGYQLRELHRQLPTLEDFFVQVTRRRSHQAPAAAS